MTKKRNIIRCTQCGTIMEVLSEGQQPTCCAAEPQAPAFEVLTENTTDAAREKHVPVVEKIEGGWRVSVGSVEHPMQEGHYIQWIELLTERDVMRHELLPGEKPEAIFLTTAEHVVAREYCNLHGLWKAEA